jgi:hypothetical protein
MALTDLQIGAWNVIGASPYDFPGTHFFVDGENGSDDNPGTSWALAKKTIFGTYGGYSLLTTLKNDVLHVVGQATAYSNTAIGAWDKDYCHLIGHTAPLYTGSRVRLTNTVATATAGEFTITGTGCVFRNIQYQFGDSETAGSLVGVALSGNGRNAFINCGFYGPFAAATATTASTRMLTITSSQDNAFYGCSFGQRTISYNSATGALVSFEGTNNTNNVFEECIFNNYNVNTASGTINYVNNAMPDSGWTLFKNCAFINHANASIADPIRFTTGAHGSVILQGSTLSGLGTLLWATNRKTTIFTFGAAPAATGGVGVNP